MSLTVVPVLTGRTSHGTIEVSSGTDLSSFLGPIQHEGQSRGEYACRKSESAIMGHTLWIIEI